uniref:Uncharacterized protein n=1 Tax=Anguilla anguilla TaxID=7936 RepID=A0A0E9VTN3_ANGAN
MYICMCVFIYMIAVILHHITLLIHFKCDQRLKHSVTVPISYESLK